MQTLVIILINQIKFIKLIYYYISTIYKIREKIFEILT